MNEAKHNTAGHARRIRSFVRREGRLTAGQQRALDELLPRYGVDGDGPIDFARLFGRRAPLTLEIGFGNGASLATMAAAAPEQDFVGIEVHRPGVGQLLAELERRGLGNVRVLCDDAVDILRQRIAPASLDRVLLFFPDPWPKRRHHKRRIVQPAFVELVASRLRPGGLFHLATDWQPYAAHMLRVLDACPAFENTAGRGRCAGRPADRPPTRFEQRGRRLGHGVHDLLYRRTPTGAGA